MAAVSTFAPHASVTWQTKRKLFRSRFKVLLDLSPIAALTASRRHVFWGYPPDPDTEHLFWLLLLKSSI
jgi:hypothetical protein